MKHLATLRRSAGVTQARVAEFLECSPARVSLLEAGRTAFHVGEADRLERWLVALDKAVVRAQQLARPAQDEFTAGLMAALPSLKRYARKMTRDGDKAADLVQDTVARGLAKRHLWQPGTSPEAWLIVIMHNQWINNGRAATSRARVFLPDSVDGVMFVTGTPERTTDYMRLRDVERAMDHHLSDEQRTVLLLTVCEGMDYEEIAKVLEIPMGTVRSRLSRGRAVLRSMALGLALVLALPVLALAQGTQLSPPGVKWGSAGAQVPAPVQQVGYDSSTGLPCIVGSSATCSLITVSTQVPTPLSYTQSVVTLTAATDGVLRAATPTAKYLFVMNIGTNPLTLNFDAPAVAGQGTALNGASVSGQQGGSFEWSGTTIPTNAIHAISTAGTTVAVIEGH